jgi:hypothetical protein
MSGLYAIRGSYELLRDKFSREEGVHLKKKSERTGLVLGRLSISRDLMGGSFWDAILRVDRKDFCKGLLRSRDRSD